MVHDSSAAKLKHPCSICGRLTTGKYGMCQRTDTPCSREYRRLWARDQSKERRAEIVRQYRRSHRIAPCLYAVIFPVPVVLKVGLTTVAPAISIGTVRIGARKRGWDAAGSSCIWTRPGDVRTEAWVQANLAFRWPGAFGKYQNRVCEWFNVAGLPLDDVVATLDEIYQGVPVDRVLPELLSTTWRPGGQLLP